MGFIWRLPLNSGGIILRSQLQKFSVEQATITNITFTSWIHFMIMFMYLSTYSLCFYPLHMASVTDKTQNAHIQTKIAWWNSHITCLLFAREIGKSTAHFPENSCLPLDQNKTCISRKQSRHVCKFVTLSILFRLEYFNLVWNVLLLSILYVIFSFVHWRNHFIRTNM